MSLKINNDTITAQDLTGGNSDTAYFNSLTPLVPNKTGYKLFGSPLQRQQLKQFANDNFPHSINYTSKFSNIVNPGDNTSFYTSTQEKYTVISNFSNSNYIKTVKNFNPESNNWTMEFCIIPASNEDGNYVSAYNNYALSNGAVGTTLRYYLSSNGTSWTTSGGSGLTTLTANSVNYIKYEYIYSTHTFNTYTKQSKADEWTPDYTNTDGIYNPNTYLQFGVSRTSVSPLKGSIIFEEIKITIGDTVWFDGSTAVAGTDYTIVGSPTITTETVSIYHPTPFTFSFDVNSSAFTQGTKYLLEHPNLMKVKTENNDLYFNFPWKNSKWYYLPNNSLQAGVNSISLIASNSQGGTTEADQIKLNVNNHNFTLVASGEDMPLITTGVLGYKEDLVF